MSFDPDLNSPFLGHNFPGNNFSGNNYSGNNSTGNVQSKTDSSCDCKTLKEHRTGLIVLWVIATVLLYIQAAFTLAAENNQLSDDAKEWTVGIITVGTLAIIGGGLYLYFTKTKRGREQMKQFSGNNSGS